MLTVLDAALRVAWSLQEVAPGLLLLPVAAASARELLGHDRRKAIYDAVRRNPGIHMRELQRITGPRWGSLQYHTAALRGGGLLLAARAGARTVLACDVHRLGPDDLRALHFLRGRRARKVAEALAREARPMTRREVAQAAHVSPRLASHHVRTMDRLGLLETEAGRPARHQSTPRLRELLEYDGGGR